jgi:hypothetical protein
MVAVLWGLKCRSYAIMVGNLGRMSGSVGASAVVDSWIDPVRRYSSRVLCCLGITEPF